MVSCQRGRLINEHVRVTNGMGTVSSQSICRAVCFLLLSNQPIHSFKEGESGSELQDL